MKAFCFSLAILCVVQTVLAIPRPDFGINGDVPNSANTASAASVLGTEFVKTGLKDITLTSGYNLLNTLKSKLTAIGDAFATLGGELADQLGLLALDDAGPSAGAFDAVNTKLTALETYISNPIQNIVDISSIDGTDIKLQFDDSFAAMKISIGSLKTALAKLKTDVASARTAAGSAVTVSSVIIRKSIPAKSVTDVILYIRNLRANIPLITYIINSSLENLVLADEFIIEIEAEAVSVVGDYSTSVSDFVDNLDTENTNLAAIITPAIDVTASLADIQADLNANTPYIYSGLPEDLTSIQTALTDGYTTDQGAIAASFATYENAVPDLIEDLNDELGSALCAPIETVSKALVANGPYSDFCFSKYSPRIYALLALTINAFDTCFERELIRLLKLDEITKGIIVQIDYNVEDLADNLSVCLSVPEANQATCFNGIEPYYNALADQIPLHEATLTGLVDKETIASYNRLGACIATSLYVTVYQGDEAIGDIGDCLETGPTA